jgi:hypothetical protein
MSESKEIPGYTHPESINFSNKKSIYKTFTPGLKPKKNEKFGNTIAEAKYGNYDFDEEKCPECNLPPQRICFCGFSDKTCSKGHTWYSNREGKLQMGNPHHR